MNGKKRQAITEHSERIEGHREEFIKALRQLPEPDQESEYGPLLALLTAEVERLYELTRDLVRDL